MKKDTNNLFGETWYNTLQKQGYAVLWEEQFINYLVPYLKSHPDGNKYGVAKGDDGSIIIANINTKLPTKIAEIFSNISK